MLIALMTAALTFASEPSEVCSVRELRESPNYQYSVERVREFVDSSEVIVRAVAVDEDHAAVGSQPMLPATVVLVVTERIRGGEVPDTLRLFGRLVEHDDFNPLPVPYTMVRPAGQRGDCHAREYRIGAEYLLLLRTSPGGLTPHWWPLAPVNEQIRGADDPWLHWVREQLRRSASTSLPNITLQGTKGRA